MDQDKKEEELEEDFGAMLAEHLPSAAPKHKGELVDATIVGPMDDLMMVTYGSKEEIPIPIDEFKDPKGELVVQPGDSVRVLVTGWDDDGAVELSYRKARHAEAALMLEQAAEHKVPVRGVVSRIVKTGIIVDVGMPAFMPASQIDLIRVPDLNVMLGQEVEALVIEYDQERKRAILSRRKLLSDRRDAERQGVMEKLVVGSTVKAVVKDVLDFGAFVMIDAVDGFVPRSELTYDRGMHPSEILSPGQTIELKILEILPETGKITLSRKRLNEDPWATIDDRFPVGTTVSGKVVAIQSFGAFVQLQEGITGLIHVKDISWESKRKTPEDYFRVGDTVSCQVLDIDLEQKRLALSLKHLSRDPWLDVQARYPIGSRHEATVSSLRDFGAIVKLDEFTEGLLHVSDLSWTVRHKHPGEVLSEGQVITVAVLEHDSAKHRLRLGLKQVTGSPFEQYAKEHKVGSTVTGKVTRFAKFGAFVELAPGVEGLMHISEVDDQRVDSCERVLHIDEEVSVKILEFNEAKKRISLSRREALKDLEKENIRQYARSDKKMPGGSAFANSLMEALKKAKDKPE